MINAVCDRIGKAAARIEAQQQLQVERQALQDANVAIHESLIQIQREKKMIGVSIRTNFDKIITPIIYALQLDMNPSQLKYIDLLKENIKEIISPFMEHDQDTICRLSPVDLLICNMIKLDLTNSKVDLISYLNNLADR